MKRIFAALFTSALLLLTACGELGESSSGGLSLPSTSSSTTFSSSATTVTTTESTTTNRTTTTKLATTTKKTTVKAATTKKIVTTTQQHKVSRTVYITPTGKRYHFKSTCGGKNSFGVELDNAIRQGYTPCKKCAQ